MIINYNRDIDEDGLEYLIETINQIDFDPEDDVLLFFTSEGGDPNLVSAFKTLLEVYNIKIVAYNRVDSAALDILLATHTDRVVLDGTIGTYHSIEFDEITLNKNLEPKLSDRDMFLKENGDVYDEGVRKSLGITGKKHDKLLLKGKEYYFKAEDLRKAIKNSSKYFKKSCNNQ